MEKKKIAVLFGGVSSEHAVSCVSAANVVENLPDEYDIIKLGITRDGRWLYFPGSTADMRTDTWESDAECRPAFLSPDRGLHGLVRQDENGRFISEKIDVVFPVLHGKNGEDGTLQGLLDLSGIPYVGCGVLASSMCMDKVAANTAFDAAGIPHCKWDWMTVDQLSEFDAIEARVSARLGYPIFVKPANAGSSVGISKAANKTALRAAVELAAQHDRKILFEETVVGKEVECAVLGNDLPFASVPGEVVAGAEFYDYDAKYVSSTSKTLIPARLEDAKLKEVSALATKAYTMLNCSGLSRCDFFVQENGTVLINEINTLPGFTPISMYPKLMAHEGISYSELLRRLVVLAEERRALLP